MFETRAGGGSVDRRDSVAVNPLGDSISPRPARPYFKKLVETLRQPQRKLEVGQPLGSYLLQDIIGSGRFGTVWLAHDTSNGIDVAIKVFSRAEFKPEHQPAAAERFCDGAAAMRRLLNKSCPQVVPVYCDPQFGDGLIWFSMRLYPKRDLWRELQRRNGLACADIIAIASDVLATLKFAHAHEIIHRDIRAQNILLDQDSGGLLRGVVSDFDIAYYEDEFRQRDGTTQLMGDRRHLPNDIFGAGDETEARFRRPSNDLYALAITTLDLLTFRHELPCDSSQEVIEAAIRDHHKNDIEPELAARLAAFLRKAISPLEVDRFKSALAYEREWKFALLGEAEPLPSVPLQGRTSPTPPPARTSTPDHSPTFPPISTSTPQETPRSSQAWLVFSAVLLFVASSLVISDWAFYHWHDNVFRSLLQGLALNARNAIAVVASGIGFAAIAGLVVRFRRAIADAASSSPKWAMAGVAISLLTFVAAVATDLPTRLKTVVANVPGECLALNKDLGVLLHISADDTSRMLAPWRLECRGKVVVRRLSIGTPYPAIAKSDRPLGTVVLQGIQGSEVTWSSGPNATPQRDTLFGVKSVVASIDAVRSLVGAKGTDKFTLALGYPRHAIQMTYGEKDVALELLRAGLAEIDGAPGPDYVKAQDEAMRARRARWAALPPDPVPPDPPQLPELTLRVIVQRSAKRLADGAYGYYYYLEGDAAALAAVESIRIISRDRHGRALNGPVPYRRSRSGKWEEIKDSAEGAVCTPPFAGETGCRMVLTSLRCAKGNDVYITTAGGVAPVGPLDACSLLGERSNGSTRKLTRELHLHRPIGGALSWLPEVESKLPTLCATNCGPQLAQEIKAAAKAPEEDSALPSGPVDVVRAVPF
jgi:serine/threonine protein kinase